MLTRKSLLCLVLCLFATDIAMAQSQAILTLENSIRSDGIEPTVEGIRGFLRDQIPSPERDQKIRQLIDQLSSDSYATRNEASRRLTQQQFVDATELATVAAETADPEVRWRVASIVRKLRSQESRSSLRKVLRLVEAKPVPGLLTEILDVAIRVEPSSQTHQLACRALSATVEPSDEIELQELAVDLSSAGDPGTKLAPTIRAAAVQGWLRVSKADPLEFLLALADDQSPIVRLAAARGLAAKENKHSLRVLLELLSADNPRIRNDAFRLMRKLTGEPLHFLAYSDETRRSESIATIQRWLDESFDTMILRAPEQYQPVFLERTLIALYEQDKVIEIDAEGNTLVQLTEALDGPWAVQGLENGHRLVSSYSNKSLVEYDADGEVVWKRTDLDGPPLSVQRLENGNTLTALSDGQKVIEVDMDGNIVWEIDVDGRPCDAKRIESGTTVISLVLTGRVIEVDSDGEIIWELNGLAQPCGARRLDSGNTLVCLWQSDEVKEFDPEGNVVWTGAGLKDPRDAQRLPNGNTMASHRHGIVEFDLAGDQIRELPFSGIGSFHYY